jgi:hypothetical protein
MARSCTGPSTRQRPSHWTRSSSRTSPTSGRSHTIPSATSWPPPRTTTPHASGLAIDQGSRSRISTATTSGRTRRRRWASKRTTRLTTSSHRYRVLEAAAGTTRTAAAKTARGARRCRTSDARTRPFLASADGSGRLQFQCKRQAVTTEAMTWDRTGGGGGWAVEAGGTDRQSCRLFRCLQRCC